eukprot:scaffold102515_cov63-Attheya_sp.AAC.1
MGWRASEVDPPNAFDFFVVSVPVTQNNIQLTHMYAIKAFIKVQQTSKTWVVLDVMDGHLPYVVDNLEAFLMNPLHLVRHLTASFDEVNITELSVYGVKGVYADRSFILDSAQHI